MDSEEERRQKGRKEGRKEGRKKGRKEGSKEGERGVKVREQIKVSGMCKRVVLGYLVKIRRNLPKIGNAFLLPGKTSRFISPNIIYQRW